MLDSTEFIVRFILAGLSVYRLAQLFALDDGPFFIFERIRSYFDRKHAKEQEQGIEQGKWASVDDFIRCPYCQGLWLSIVFGSLVIYPVADWLLIIVGISGLQARLQGTR